MSSGQRAIALDSMRRLFDSGTAVGQSDRQLLDRFIAARDETAFEAILRRHGPMVLGVCRRAIADQNDVDDAFQATFLILVRKAGSIHDRDVLATWLFGVARRVAVRASTIARRRRARERNIAENIDVKDPRVARLFPNYKADEAAYFKKTGIYPIMHVVGIKKEIVDKYPWVPVNLYRAFEQSKAAAMKRMENPRVAPIVWYREAWEEQEEVFKSDPWEYGLTERNVHNLETLVGYSHEQGMIKRKIPLEELFLDVSQGRRRGGEASL